MKIIITCLYLLLHFSAQCQTQRFFVQLFDASGKSIPGNSVERGFERQIEANSSTSSLQNPRLFFTMNTNASSGVLQRMIKANERISSGLLTVAQPNREGRLVPVYTVKIQNAQVLSCSNQSNVNGSVTSVELQADRIGFTYYQQDLKTGINKTGSKSGFDWTTNKEWTNF